MMKMFKSNDDKSTLSVSKETNKPGMTKSSSTRIAGQAKMSPREISKAKSSPNVLKEPSPKAPTSKTQIGIRLNKAVKKNPKKSGRSQDIVPLLRECEGLQKRLHEFIVEARKYRKTMMDLETNRTSLYHKTAKLSSDTHFTEVVGSETGNMMKGTLTTLQERLSQTTQRHSQVYQDKIIEYATEWETILRKMTDIEVSQAHKLHKTVQHYEDKVAKLRKQINDKQDNGKTPTANQTEKLQRNQNKLSTAWEDYDAAATRTANLLEEATNMGWRDLHPLIHAMISFEMERDADEHNLWKYVGSIQDELLAVVSQHEELPPPESPVYQEEEQQQQEEEHTVDPTEVESTERTEVHVNSSDPEEEKREEKTLSSC